MFRKILGGFVLAAVGYGLKKYVDEYGIFDKVLNKDNQDLNDNETNIKEKEITREIIKMMRDSMQKI